MSASSAETKNFKTGPAGCWYLYYIHNVQKEKGFALMEDRHAKEKLKATNEKDAVTEAEEMWVKIVNKRPPFHAGKFSPETGRRVEESNIRDHPHYPRVVYEIVLYYNPV